MAKIFGISTDGVTAGFERLTDREKKLTLLLVSVFGFLVVGGAMYWFISEGMEKRAQIESLQHQTDEINALRGRYADAKSKQEQEERRFRTNKVSLFSLVQASANRYGLTIYDLNEQKAAAGGDSRLLESDVTLSLKQVSIDRLSAFMESVEDSTHDGVVKIIRLKIKTRFDAPDLLDVQMTVATWKSA